MTVYEAIEEMRRLTKENTPFSFTNMSYHRDKQTSSGIIEVSNAKLIAKQHSDKPEVDLQERYFDYDTGNIRTFYIGTLMTFNGRKLELT